MTILGGTNATVTQSPTDVWTTNSVGPGVANYKNTGNYLVIDNNAGTI